MSVGVADRRGSALEQTAAVWRFVPGVAVAALFVALIAQQVAAILATTGGKFLYVLDDAYIHLRLSEVIARSGTYGINPGEYSSPSSSILWPLLLAPFATTSFHQFIPLVLNGLAGLASIALLSVIGSRVLGPPTDPRGVLYRTAALAIVFLAFNPVGLTMIGMEHEGQVLCALAAALVVIEAGRNMTSHWLIYALVVLGPLLRYECLVTSGVALLALLFTGRLRLVVSLGLPIAAGVLGFSLFLLGLGLEPLPSSIIVKTAGGGVFDVGHWWPILGYAIRHDSSPLICLVVTPLLSWLVVRLRPSGRRWLIPLSALICVVVGHLMFGQFGWHSRYEVYAVAFCAAVSFAIIFDTRDAWDRWRTTRACRIAWAVVLGNAAISYSAAGIGGTVCAVGEVYTQQYQMARLNHEFLSKTVGVNDIGLVSYASRSEVVDLWGLGSGLARRLRLSHVHGWVAQTVALSPVQYAMVYADWFGGDLPPEWRLLGTLTSAWHACAVADPSVEIYAVAPGDDDTLRAGIARWAATLPPGASFKPAT